MAPAALASVGDSGVLNVEISPKLRDVWIDRDLSWLDFNERVLAEALDDRTPLLEKAKFLAIFSSNLDEFFMMRQAGLHHGATEAQRNLMQQMRDKLLPALQRQAECYRRIIVPGLAHHRVFIRSWNDLTPGQKDEASKYFDSELSPALTPLAIDPEHPFPFLSNLSTSLVFKVHNAARGESLYARVKVPEVLKQWVSLQTDLADGQRLLVPLHDIIRGCLHNLYGEMEITDATIVRLTRDAEVEPLQEEAVDMRAAVKEEVRQRRYEPVVRLQFGPGADPTIKEHLGDRFRLSPLEVYDLDEEVDFTTLFELAGLPFPKLRDPAWTPLRPAWLQEEGVNTIFTAIRAGDHLVHHPYDSFDETVAHFISSAADDPQTVSIKMTAYRLGDDTPFVKSLIRAAERGKQVACVLEIKARFDEERNLHWAALLEAAGAHVTFGVSGLKTHAKLALVVRNEDGQLHSYAHIGTGNYNVKTARIYEDFGLFTCNPLLTHDVVKLFHYLTGHADALEHSALVVAPLTMRQRFLELIHREAKHKRSGHPARIVAKANQLEDPEIIEALCQASEAGVPINLIIRGFCCLRPQVPHHSHNIHVRSIIGRFLEHSRIYYFANGHKNPADGDYFIGSADWMFRNLSKRIEVVTPVLASSLKQHLWEILDICLHDKRQAWVLKADGSYVQQRQEQGSESPENLGTQQILMNLARARASE